MPPALPVLVSSGAPRALERIALSGTTGSEAGSDYTEAWLQDLVQRCPEVLPTSEIEPGFGRLIPVATEVPCGHGYIDNLFVTGDGGIALVETKLWRNPESRRAVVTQALDYAAALARMGYEAFERAALGGKFPSGRPGSLYEIVSAQADALEQSEFTDAIATNLRRGRMLVIAAGDGIRAEAEALAELIQSHAGARFTFALVAIELFRASPAEILAVPRTIAKTVLIERGVVRVEDGHVTVEPATRSLTAPGESAPRTTMTEELFLELMAKRQANLPDAIREFLALAASADIKPDWRASLNLKWYGESATINLGYIRRDGSVATDTTFYTARGSPAATRYLGRFAELCGGKVVEKDGGNGPYVTAKDGSSIKVEQLLPGQAERWVVAMVDFISDLEIEAQAED